MTAEPLQHRDAEELLIGAVLSGAPDLDDLFVSVKASDFYLPWHGQVWNAAERVHAAGNRPEPTSVRLALAGTGEPADPIRIFELASSCDMPFNAAYYAGLVTTASGLRNIAAAGIKVQQLGNTHGDLEVVREQARQAVDEACRGRSISRARTLGDLLPAAIAAAEAGTTPVLSTCWPDIDRSIGGIAPGRLIVFGARPGGGKSLAGTNLALHVASHHGHAALIASLEMPESEVMNRLLAAHAGVDLTALTNARVTEGDWGRLAAKHEELSSMPVYVDDTPDLSVQALRALVRDVQRERDDLALIVVDYLQLMRPATGRRGSSRAEEISQIARDLKLLARESGACVVAMAQVNREGAKNDGGPRLIDLREGGSENDADAVILLHRPDADLPEVTATTAKNRHGPSNVSATLHLQGHYARLASVAWSPSVGAR